jgi:hypothetical protein
MRAEPHRDIESGWRGGPWQCLQELLTGTRRPSDCCRQEACMVDDPG